MLSAFFAFLSGSNRGGEGTSRLTEEEMQLLFQLGSLLQEEKRGSHKYHALRTRARVRFGRPAAPPEQTLPWLSSGTTPVFDCSGQNEPRFLRIIRETRGTSGAGLIWQVQYMVSSKDQNSAEEMCRRQVGFNQFQSRRARQGLSDSQVSSPLGCGRSWTIIEAMAFGEPPSSHASATLLSACRGR